MQKPLLSIIIPALNEEHFLPHLLESLTTQHERNFEVIVVDGQSKDKTVSIARSYKNQLPSLTILVADHASLPYQRNLGAEAARGQWLVFVDADTVLYSYTLERLRKHIETVKHDVFLTTWFSPDSEDINDVRLTLLATFFYEASRIMKRAVSPGPFTVVKRTAFETIHGYDVEHPFLEDQDFSQRMRKEGFSLSLIRETLYVWSLRRYRKEGTLKVFQAYSKAIFPILFGSRVPKNMKGYTMGGHVFSAKKKQVKSTLIRQTEQKIRKLMQEIFE